MEESKRKALAKELNEFTRNELFFLAKLCVKYDVPLIDMLELVSKGHDEMLRMAKECDEELFGKPEIVEE